MKKEIKDKIIVCMIFIIVFLVFYVLIFQPKVIFMDRTKNEYVELDGEYFMMKVDNEYWAFCDRPEKRLFQIKIE